MKRDIIRINDERCTGCGNCITGCPEGALKIIDGKAKVISDLFCDGLGACVGGCPEDAIEVETREAQPYDERKVMENVVRAGPAVIKAHLQHLQEHSQEHLTHEAIDFLKEHSVEVPNYEEVLWVSGCRGSMMQDSRQAYGADKAAMSTSALGNWPIQLRLVNANSPFLKNAELVVAGDCVSFSYSNFHRRFLPNKVLIILCPKLDTPITDYVDKLSEIFAKQDITSISVVHMEVPCCSGIGGVVRKALENAQKDVPIEDYTISIYGHIM